MNDPIQPVPSKPDAELAEELKNELAEAAKPYLLACTKALAAGFHVQSQVGQNAFKQMIITDLKLIKIF
jgi:hypothetical protein